MKRGFETPFVCVHKRYTWGAMTSMDTSPSASSASEPYCWIIPSLETPRTCLAVTGAYCHDYRRESCWIHVAVGSFALSIGETGESRSEQH